MKEKNRTLSEHESKELLKNHGINFAEEIEAKVMLQKLQSSLPKGLALFATALATWPKAINPKDWPISLGNL